MATWKGTPKKFEVEFVHKNPNVWDLEIGDVTFKWEYNTTCDSLSIITEHPNMREHEADRMGPDWAEAQLYTMAHWFATWHSPERLVELLKPILEKGDQ